MVALRRLKSGGFAARKVIPRDVRDEYGRLFGRNWEEKLSLPREMPAHEAKARHGEWLAEIETRIGTLRAGRRNEGRPLTRQDAQALAAQWYAWFVGRHARNARSADHWRKEASEFHAQARREPVAMAFGSNTDVALMEELAAMVTWLASEDCALTTGSVFDFSGEVVRAPA